MADRGNSSAKARKAVLRIDGNGHRRLRQEASHLGIDGLAVFGAEEVVGGVDGAAPEVDEGGAVVGARGAKGGHGFTKVLRKRAQYEASRSRLQERIHPALRWRMKGLYAVASARSTTLSSKSTLSLKGTMGHCGHCASRSR